MRAKTLRRYFNFFNYEVNYSRNGKEGVEKVLEQVPDTIISDMIITDMAFFTQFTKMTRLEVIRSYSWSNKH